MQIPTRHKRFKGKENIQWESERNLGNPFNAHGLIEVIHGFVEVQSAIISNMKSVYLTQFTTMAGTRAID